MIYSFIVKKKKKISEKLKLQFMTINQPENHAKKDGDTQRTNIHATYSWATDQ